MKAILNGFRDECELMEADKHANVVQFIGVFDQDGSALLVIKLMDQTLDAFLTRNRGHFQCRNKFASVCLQIALGMLFIRIHEHDLHRDLTAMNVLMIKRWQRCEDQ